MKQGELKKRVAIIKKAGFRVEESDYGWTVGVVSKKAKRALVVSEVYRSERDGYTGYKLKDMDMLEEWLQKNK